MEKRMAEFSKLVITNKGQALIAKMIAGEGSIVFTKIAASSKEYEESGLQEIDSLDEVRQTTLISKITRTNKVAELEEICGSKGPCRFR